MGRKRDRAICEPEHYSVLSRKQRAVSAGRITFLESISRQPWGDNYLTIIAHSQKVNTNVKLASP